LSDFSSVVATAFSLIAFGMASIVQKNGNMGQTAEQSGI
jgi:hypothetical protein